MPRKEILTITKSRDGLGAKDTALGVNKRDTSKRIVPRSCNMMQQRRITRKEKPLCQAGHEAQKLLKPQRKIVKKN